MKKQANPTIKAHLIRSAFYLLLVVAACAIPFALAQRSSQASMQRAPQDRLQTTAGLTVPPDAASGLRAYDVRRLPGAAGFSSAGLSGKHFGPRTTRLLRTLLPNAVYMIDDGTAED